MKLLHRVLHGSVEQRIFENKVDYFRSLLNVVCDMYEEEV